MDQNQRKLLVSDFDGTLTRRDFFWLVVDAFAPAHLEEYWQGYKDGRLTHFESLAGIFAKLNASEADMDALLNRAEPDPDLRIWLQRLDQVGWDVMIVSAGCEWYISRILAKSGVSLPIHANPGDFIPGDGLKMRLPKQSPFFHPQIGIDKAGVVRHYQQAGRIVAFAGDGYPDREAAVLVPTELRFARGDLAKTLDQDGIGYTSFERWGEIAARLCANG